MFEVEVKAHVSGGFEDVRERLHDMGAVFQNKEHQIDRVYGFSNDFPPKDGGVIGRIRTETNACMLELKEIHREKGGIELAFPIHEIAPYHDFFLKLNLQLFFTIDKLRENFAWKNFVISLDEVQDLGQFIEIEKMVAHESEKQEALAECTEVLNTLAPQAIITKEKYGDMMWHVRNTTNI